MKKSETSSSLSIHEYKNTRSLKRAASSADIHVAEALRRAGLPSMVNSLAKPDQGGEAPRYMQMTKAASRRHRNHRRYVTVIRSTGIQNFTIRMRNLHTICQCC